MQIWKSIATGLLLGVAGGSLLALASGVRSTRQPVSTSAVTYTTPVAVEDEEFDFSKFGVGHMMIGDKGVALVIVTYKGNVVTAMLVPHDLVESNGCHQPEEPEENKGQDEPEPQ